MPVIDTSIYRTRDDIITEMITQLLAAIPDAYVGEDGVIRIIYEIESGQLENLYLACQLLLEDMFVTTASYQALQRHGEQYGLPMMMGTPALGEVILTGQGGTFAPIGTEVAYVPGGGVDPVFFQTTVEATIPDLGTPTPPSITNDDSGANPLDGTYEYVVTFVSANGESLPSDPSNFVSVSTGRINVGSIPIGSPETIARRLYRDKNGQGTFRFVVEIADNTTTTYLDAIPDATVGIAPGAPTVDTASAIAVAAQAVEPGQDGNAAPNTITVLSNAPLTLTAVSNPEAFVGGTEMEDSESYRQRLLAFMQNPQTGSPSDIKAWAENVPGVESATVSENEPVAGTVTVRISGPGGSVPSAEVIAAVQAELDSLSYANITIVVTTFTAVPTNVTVDITVIPPYEMTTVTPQVQTAVAEYINSLEVGATLYVAGIVDAVFGLAGIRDVVVTTPSSNQTTAAGSKRTAGTITVV